jgi:pSer/pThr/pTyr-binding forkhead associated (FHA) protein
MKMRNILITFFLFIPALLFAQTGPKFEITGGDKIDLGDHLQGKEVKYEIVFKNSGDEDLKVTNVSTTCGCSTALLSKDLIPPGGEGSIQFTFNGNGYGKVTKGVVVYTNEPTSIHNISMTMNMVQPLILDPASIITSGKVGEEINQTATLKNSFDKVVTISEVTSNSPAVKVSSDRTELNSGESASLNISIKIYEESPVNAAVIIKTSEGEYQIPILVDIKNN